MRFILASLDHAKDKSRLLKNLLAAMSVEASLTNCQAAVAECLGYPSWAELKTAPRTPASPVDEAASLEEWRARIAIQCGVIAEEFGLDERDAAGVALALRLTSRARSADTQADLNRFAPKGLSVVPATVPVPAGKVSAWIIQWTEHERGWGSRPDGYSLHASAEDAGSYVESYWDRMPNKLQDEFSAPENDAVEVEVSPGHPVAELLARGAKRFYSGAEHDAVRSLWPSKAAGWQSIKVG